MIFLAFVFSANFVSHMNSNLPVIICGFCVFCKSIGANQQVLHFPLRLSILLVQAYFFSIVMCFFLRPQIGMRPHMSSLCHECVEKRSFASCGQLMLWLATFSLSIVESCVFEFEMQRIIRHPLIQENLGCWDRLVGSCVAPCGIA